MYRRNKTFKNSREDVEDEHRSNQPSTSKSDENVFKVRSVLTKNRGLTVRMTADEVEVSENSVHCIFTDVLCMRKICAKMLFKNLNKKLNKKKIACPLAKTCWIA